MSDAFSLGIQTAQSQTQLRAQQAQYTAQVYSNLLQQQASVEEAKIRAMGQLQERLAMEAGQTARERMSQEGQNHRSLLKEDRDDARTQYKEEMQTKRTLIEEEGENARKMADLRQRLEETLFTQEATTLRLKMGKKMDRETQLEVASRNAQAAASRAILQGRNGIIQTAINAGMAPADATRLGNLLSKRDELDPDEVAYLKGLKNPKAEAEREKTQSLKEQRREQTKLRGMAYSLRMWQYLSRTASKDPKTGKPYTDASGRPVTNPIQVQADMMTNDNLVPEQFRGKVDTARTKDAITKIEDGAALVATGRLKQEDYQRMVAEAIQGTGWPANWWINYTGMVETRERHRVNAMRGFDVMIQDMTPDEILDAHEDMPPEVRDSVDGLLMQSGLEPPARRTQPAPTTEQPQPSGRPPASPAPAPTGPQEPHLPKSGGGPSSWRNPFTSPTPTGPEALARAIPFTGGVFRAIEGAAKNLTGATDEAVNRLDLTEAYRQALRQRDGREPSRQRILDFATRYTPEEQVQMLRLIANDLENAGQGPDNFARNAVAVYDEMRPTFLGSFFGVEPTEQVPGRPGTYGVLAGGRHGIPGQSQDYGLAGDWLGQVFMNSLIKAGGAIVKHSWGKAKGWLPAVERAEQVAIEKSSRFVNETLNRLAPNMTQYVLDRFPQFRLSAPPAKSGGTPTQTLLREPSGTVRLGPSGSPATQRLGPSGAPTQRLTTPGGAPTQRLTPSSAGPATTRLSPRGAPTQRLSPSDSPGGTVRLDAPASTPTTRLPRTPFPPPPNIKFGPSLDPRTGLPDLSMQPIFLPGTPGGFGTPQGFAMNLPAAGPPPGPVFVPQFQDEYRRLMGGFAG